LFSQLGVVFGCQHFVAAGLNKIQTTSIAADFGGTREPALEKTLKQGWMVNGRYCWVNLILHWIPPFHDSFCLSGSNCLSCKHRHLSVEKVPVNACFGIWLANLLDRPCAASGLNRYERKDCPSGNPALFELQQSRHCLPGSDGVYRFSQYQHRGVWLSKGTGGGDCHYRRQRISGATGMADESVICLLRRRKCAVISVKVRMSAGTFPL